MQHQREEFISMVIHELNQPLTNITGHARLLGRGATLSEREHRSLDLIATEGLRMARLLRDLADASRLATGDFTITPEVCDAIDLVGAQVEMARASTDRHSISFSPGVDSLAATWDRDRITQVVSNLLKNAISHTDGGHISVTCLRDGEEVVITVADSGTGIPGDRMEAIFEPHVRLPGRPDAHGSGLGLYIARGIVETHGGRIWAGNVTGAGAQFTVMLPLACAAQGALAGG
jgi:signal transduction histidine kinase